MNNALWITKPTLFIDGINPHAQLPYGLTVEEIVSAVNYVYDFLHDLNMSMVKKYSARLEDILLGNSFAGMLSELIVRGISESSIHVVRNRKIGGHPDLLPRGKYPGDTILKGEEGIEIKAS